MTTRVETKSARRERPNWEKYDEALSGLTNYWYPVTWSKKVAKKPVTVKLLNEEIVLIRDGGKVHALRNACPHRGVPLSTGRQEFLGTWACAYHGWVFDLETGMVKAAITDGPDSPVCGKVGAKKFPVEERLGLVWVYVGDKKAPPVEADIPEVLLQPDSVVLGRITMQKGNWRYACENAFDEGHYKYLHRYGALFSFFQEFPAWSTINIIDEEGGWITRDVKSIAFGDEYTGLGVWPPKFFWKRRAKGFRVSMRLPGIMRNHHVGTPRTNYSWYVPVGNDQYIYLQFYTVRARGWAALKFWLHFWLYLRPVHFVQFNKQDLAMVESLPETPPVQLYRPDSSIFAWRRFVETARQFAGAKADAPRDATVYNLAE